jgi:hypothetical protein
VKKIGILADTHGSLLPRVFSFFSDCDQIWHAGDIGNMETYDALAQFKPLVAVYGNIDDQKVRKQCKEIEVFSCEQVKVAMMHIGGYPGRYTREAQQTIRMHHPDLFITGHSHILRVMHDQKNNLLFINPGAAGKSGFHKVITCTKITIDGNRMYDMEVLETERKTNL